MVMLKGKVRGYIIEMTRAITGGNYEIAIIILNLKKKRLCGRR